MYLIQIEFLGRNLFLAWQPPAYCEDGYFWAQIEVIRNILNTNPEFNSDEHPFSFKTKQAAEKKILELDLRNAAIVKEEKLNG